MTKTICFLQLLLLCWTLSWAQGNKKQLLNTQKPDLSGRWVLDHEEGESGRSNPRVPGEIKLIVIHHEPEIKITRMSNSKGRQVVQETTYYSDARGEKNLGPRISTKPNNTVDEVMKSKTKWNRDKLVTQTDIHKAESGATLGMRIIDEWKLSDDGKILTQTTTYRVDNGVEFGMQGTITPARPKVFKNVFRRDP